MASLVTSNEVILENKVKNVSGNQRAGHYFGFITFCNNIELLNNLVRLVYNIKFFSIHFKLNRGTIVVSIWQLDLQLPMQSVLIIGG
jgi:hypothetical protein